MASHSIRMDALAFLYDRLADFPTWINRLTPHQLEQVARVMVSWRHATDPNHPVMPLEEVEKREIIRAINLCEGDAIKAAKLLRIGKTTMYRKMHKWYLTDDTLAFNKHRYKRKAQAIASDIYS